MWEWADADPDPFLHIPTHWRDEAFVGTQGNRAPGAPSLSSPWEKCPGVRAAGNTVGPELGLGILPQPGTHSAVMRAGGMLAGSWARCPRGKRGFLGSPWGRAPLCFLKAQARPQGSRWVCNRCGLPPPWPQVTHRAWHGGGTASGTGSSQPCQAELCGREPRVGLVPWERACPLCPAAPSRVERQHPANSCRGQGPGTRALWAGTQRPSSSLSLLKYPGGLWQPPSLFWSLQQMRKLSPVVLLLGRSLRSPSQCPHPFPAAPAGSRPRGRVPSLSLLGAAISGQPGEAAGTGRAGNASGTPAPGPDMGLVRSRWQRPPDNWLGWGLWALYPAPCQGSLDNQVSRGPSQAQTQAGLGCPLGRPSHLGVPKPS